METGVKEVELRDLWRRYKDEGDDGARERLVVAYSPMVKFVAARLGAALGPLPRPRNRSRPGQARARAAAGADRGRARLETEHDRGRTAGGAAGDRQLLG